MRDTLAFSLFSVLKSKEITRFAKFLKSGYFNRRTDVLNLLYFFIDESKNEFEQLTRENTWSRLFPDQPYDRVQFNYTINFFCERLEQFLACEELLACLLYTSPSPRDRTRSRMPSFALKKKKTQQRKLY